MRECSRSSHFVASRTSGSAEKCCAVAFCDHFCNVVSILGRFVTRCATICLNWGRRSLNGYSKGGKRYLGTLAGTAGMFVYFCRRRGNSTEREHRWTRYLLDDKIYTDNGYTLVDTLLIADLWSRIGKHSPDWFEIVAGVGNCPCRGVGNFLCERDPRPGNGRFHSVQGCWRNKSNL